MALNVKITVSWDAMPIGLVDMYQTTWYHTPHVTVSLDNSLMKEIKHMYFDQVMLRTIHIIFYKQIPWPIHGPYVLNCYSSFILAYSILYQLKATPKTQKQSHDKNFNRDEWQCSWQCALPTQKHYKLYM